MQPRACGVGEAAGCFPWRYLGFVSLSLWKNTTALPLLLYQASVCGSFQNIIIFRSRTQHPLNGYSPLFERCPNREETEPVLSDRSATGNPCTYGLFAYMFGGHSMRETLRSCVELLRSVGEWVCETPVSWHFSFRWDSLEALLKTVSSAFFSFSWASSWPVSRDLSAASQKKNHLDLFFSFNHFPYIPGSTFYPGICLRFTLGILVKHMLVAHFCNPNTWEVEAGLLWA